MSSRAENRHLRQQVGEAAAAAVVETRDIAQRLALQHRVLAGQVLEFERTLSTVVEAMIGALVARVNHFERMTWWQRLRWTVTGHVPPMPIPECLRFPDDPEPCTADGSNGEPAYPGDGV